MAGEQGAAAGVGGLFRGDQAVAVEGRVGTGAVDVLACAVAAETVTGRAVWGGLRGGRFLRGGMCMPVVGAIEVSACCCVEGDGRDGADGGHV